MKRVHSIIIGILLGDIVAWLFYGAKLFTRMRVAREVRDPLFGTTGIEWQPGFVYGADIALTIAIVCIVVLVILRRKK